MRPANAQHFPRAQTAMPRESLRRWRMRLAQPRPADLLAASAFVPAAKPGVLPRACNAQGCNAGRLRKPRRDRREADLEGFLGSPREPAPKGPAPARHDHNFDCRTSSPATIIEGPSIVSRCLKERCKEPRRSEPPVAAVHKARSGSTRSPASPMGRRKSPTTQEGLAPLTRMPI